MSNVKDLNNIVKKDELGINTSQYVTLTYKSASPARRFIGAFIDLLAITFIPYATLAILTLYGGLPNFVYIATAFITPFFNMLCEYWFHGKSIGKLVTKTAVVNDKCESPSFAQCFTRWILFPIDFYLFIGLFMIGLKGYRLGDLFSGCRVIMKQVWLDTEVNFDREFQFAQPDYKPTFKKACNLTLNEANAIKLVLFDKGYWVYTKRVTELVKQKLELPDNTSVNKDTLFTIYQDALYYNNL